MGPTPAAGVALPPKGRRGRPPTCPYDLAEAGRKWWLWAWATPQATQWDKGSHYVVARRAQLEDDLAALDQFDPHALDWLFAGAAAVDDEMLKALGYVIGELKGLAGGRLQVVAKMAELDDRLGLNPRAMAALKWVVKEDKPASKGGLNDILAQAQKRQKREAEATAG